VQWSASTPLSDAGLKRLAWLDLSKVQHRFVTGAADGVVVDKHYDILLAPPTVMASATT
jgi:hypothetical protein